VFEEIGEEFDVDLGCSRTEHTLARETRREVVTRKLYNDPDEIVEATNALGIDRLVPQHWRRWRSIHADPAALEKASTTFEYPHVIEGVEVGDRLRLETGRASSRRHASASKVGSRYPCVISEPGWSVAAQKLTRVRAILSTVGLNNLVAHQNIYFNRRPNHRRLRDICLHRRSSGIISSPDDPDEPV